MFENFIYKTHVVTNATIFQFENITIYNIVRLQYAQSQNCIQNQIHYIIIFFLI